MALASSEPVSREALVYLNRLSDALFVMARYENAAKGVADVLWDSRAGRRGGRGARSSSLEPSGLDTLRFDRLARHFFELSTPSRIFCRPLSRRLTMPFWIAFWRRS